MAYTALPPSNASNLNSTSPALPDLAFEDLASSFSFTNDRISPSPPPSAKRVLPNVLKSITGSQRSGNSAYSYDVVEDDDYEQPEVISRFPKPLAISKNGSSNTREDVPARTASISRHLPLHNPTPDLQSIQGAYVKNVERLEDSAERISLAGSIEDELNKIKSDMRRSESLGRTSHQYQPPLQGRKFSSSNSMTNSIIGVNATARSGGYSPAAYITSPAGSVNPQRNVSQRSAARMPRQSNLSNALPEPQQEGRPLESAMVHSPPTHAVQPRTSTDSRRPSSSRASDSEQDRPGTSASNDTYRQAQNLFTDFDGTHFSPIDDDELSRRISLSHPPLAKDSKAYKEAQPGEKMIYYPAPVPVMLNLPKRLSRGDWAQQEKRRSKVLSSIPMEARKSAIWLANVDSEADPEPEPQPRNSAHLPAQLRASVFFDAPGTQANVKLKHGSAVMTLDNILDAAAYAPVSAFTDHPITGSMGREVYAPEPVHKKKSSKTESKRRSSLSNILSGRKSSATFSGGRRGSQILDDEFDVLEDEFERAAEKSIAPDDDELPDEKENKAASDEEDSEDEQSEAQHQLGFLGAPTTLLAELQMRKAQQKLRNRTAANAFPQGMHSTLLELDAVTQVQQKARKQKHVALAWEDQEAVERANNDDEDVPLGMLLPEKERQKLADAHRPIGLMEKRELEENEPLSFRRARLRGEPYRPPQPAHVEQYQETSPLVDMPDEEEEEIEGETLAQRRKRIQEQKEAALVAVQTSGPTLADDIASQLGIDAEQIGGTKTPEPEAEETLGQRRKRLQAEAQKQAPTLKQKTSMGDLLRANPIGSRNEERQISAESKVSLLMNRRDPSMPLVGHIQAAQPGTKALPDPLAEQPRQNNMTVPGQPLAGPGLSGATLPQHWPGRPQMPAPRPSGPLHTQTSPSMSPGFGQLQNGFGNMPGMQSMSNLNMMGMPQQQQMQYPYNNQNMNMSHMSLGMNNMGLGMNYQPAMMPGYGQNPMQMGMQMPMGMNMNMNMPMNGMNMGMPMGYGMQNINMTPYDAIGMGPPLTNQQRNTIDQWRQSVA